MNTFEQSIKEKLGLVDIQPNQDKELTSSVTEIDEPEDNTFETSIRSKLGIQADEPTLGEIGKGLAAELAIAEGLKYGGFVGGGFLGGFGAGVGYVGGALLGGVTGSIAAQKIEGRDDISYGRVVADTLLNLDRDWETT